MSLRLPRRALLIVALLILVSGCSALKLGYENADTWLQWRARQYFDFEAEQKPEFERRMQRFLAWHRQTALPQYNRLANEMADRLARGLSQADLVWGYDVLQAQVRQSLGAGSAEMGELLDGLSPAQIERFQMRLAKENRDHAKEHGLGEAPEERREKRLKRNVQRLEDWYGSLSEAQIERVRQYNARAPLDTVLRDLDRKRLQGELIVMLRAKEARKRLVPWMVAWDQNREPAYAKLFGENRQEFYRMVLDLDKMLSPEQRSRAVMRMRGFAGDFVALAGRNTDGAR